MKMVYGLYSDPDAAQRALERLRAAGVADRAVRVVSSEPFEEYEFSHRDRATWIYWVASAGGAVGLAAGYLLTSMTQRAWPLQTGGMPIVAPWPNLIIVFELTMLFAILATVATLLVTTRLPRRQSKLYDTAVSHGKILVGLEDPDVPVETLERALASQDGTAIKVVTM